jgi:hypothetical protein
MLHDEFGNASPQFNTPLEPYKIFGLSDEVEKAYKGAYRDNNHMADLWETYSSFLQPYMDYFNQEEGAGWDEEYMLNFLFRSPETFMDKIQELHPDLSTGELLSRVEFDSNMFYKITGDDGTSAQYQAVIDKAVADGEISSETRHLLNTHIQYGAEQEQQAMIDAGHNEDGMPIDANGVEQEAPMYIDNNGVARPRVYHRATQMWYNPEMLNDMQASQGLGSYVNNPYDLASVAGTRLGLDGNDSPLWVQQDDADHYRFAVPGINNTNFDPDGTPLEDAFHGIYINRTGVNKIGDHQLEESPSIKDGNLVNHKPMSAEEVSQHTHELARTSSQLQNPAVFVDENGNETNHITVDSEGHFDGGWKEWLQNPTLTFLDAPGIRRVPGVQKFGEAMSGKPHERVGAVDPKTKTSWWTGPATYAGRESVWGPSSTPEGAEQTRLQRLRETGSIDKPATPPISKVRQFYDSVNRSFGYKAGTRTGRKLPGYSMYGHIQDYLDGRTQDQEVTSAVNKLLLQHGAESLGIPQTEVQEYVNALMQERQLRADPRRREENVTPIQPGQTPMPTVSPPPVSTHTDVSFDPSSGLPITNPNNPQEQV